MNMHIHEPEFTYCPVCGGRLKPKQLKNEERLRPACVSCEYVHYYDPKVVSCIIIEQGNQIVLLRRGISPQKGKWVMPGGYVDRGERVEEAAAREAREECGLEVQLDMLLGVYSYTGQVQIVLVYVGRRISGDLISGDETIEARFFLYEDIPWQALAFRSTTDALRDYFSLKSKG